ncbi:uncharacterized protein WM277_012039 [Molossus nigricans]
MYHRPDRTLMADLLFLRCYSFSHLQIIAFLKRPLKNLIEPPLGTLPKKVQHYLNVSMVGLHLHDVRCRGNSSRLPSGDNRLHLRTSKSTPKKSFSSASFSALPPSSSQKRAINDPPKVNRGRMPFHAAAAVSGIRFVPLPGCEKVLQL